MDMSRRGFIAAAGASVGSDIAHAQEHGHDHQAVPSDPALRTKALESLLVEKGLVDRAALDALVDTYEHKIGPRNGARVVARAWVDPAYKKRLLADATGRDRRARLHGHAGREHAGRGKYARRAQHDRLHAMLLLSLAGAGPASRLVQISALSFAFGDRPARRLARIWSRTAG